MKRFHLLGDFGDFAVGGIGAVLGLITLFSIGAETLFLPGCQTISTFDSQAYLQQTGALAEMLKLMDKATTPYSENADQIAATNLTVEKAYEYDRGRPLNRITIAQWDLIRDPNQGSFAGFLAFWKAHVTVSRTFITEQKHQIGEQIDRITGLETGKIH